jgi:hypothetical protein
MINHTITKFSFNYIPNGTRRRRAQHNNNNNNNRLRNIMNVLM